MPKEPEAGYKICILAPENKQTKAFHSLSGKIGHGGKILNYSFLIIH